jgi:hypothetical protein
MVIRITSGRDAARPALAGTWHRVTSPIILEYMRLNSLPHVW